ncbi:MAG: hypothetical protein H0U40_11450 [Chloroflexia bacterium]|nr:hypothetical protein [Chloroflexia bacterium]
MLPIDAFFPLPGQLGGVAIRWSAAVVLCVTVCGLSPDLVATCLGTVVVAGAYANHGLVRYRLALRHTDRPMVTRLDLAGPLPVPRHDITSPADEGHDAMVGLVAVTVYSAAWVVMWRVLPAEGFAGRALSGAAPLVAGYAVLQALPGLPLEGGRLFRAFAWSVTGSRPGSARASERYAAWIATPMIVAGIWSLPLDAPRPYFGLALAATGWHLAVTSAATRRRIAWQYQSQSVPLSRYVPGLVLPPGASLSRAARLVLEFKVPILILPSDGSTPGVITRQTLEDQPRADWASTSVGRVMIPIARLPALQLDETVTTAVGLLQDTGQSTLVIFAGNHPRAAVTLVQLVGSLPI